MSEMILEAQLIKDSKKGDSAAFGKLMGIYRDNLFTYLLRMCRERMTAEDLLQETLIKAWNGLKSYNEQQKFSSWLFTIAHNVSIDAIRMRKVRERTTYLSDKNEIAYDYTPHSELVMTESRVALQKEVENLPDDQRRVFLLRQHSTLSFKEIAIIMKQPLNTVLSHMHYAIKKLRRCLNEE
jgi:RNA polymerase sigma-70 factor (ECF subfamily)